MVKCANDYCRKEIERVYPLKSPHKIWDLCLDCSIGVYHTLKRLLENKDKIEIAQHINETEINSGVGASGRS